MKQFDVAIVGGGPGGYVAAIRAAKLGLAVALVEADALGGTCLNRGCIPSKTLLKHAEVMNQIKHANDLAIKVNDFSYSIDGIVDRKNSVIQQLNNGIKMLLKQNKISVYNGMGTVSNDKIITIQSENGEKTEIKADNVILANGSKPVIPNIPGIHDLEVHTSDTIFDIQEVPNHLVIVGGGVIGLEIACIFNSFGTKVEMIEMADRILPLEDSDAAQFLAKELKKLGVVMHTAAKVTEFSKEGQKSMVHFEKNGKQDSVATDEILMAIGRKPNTSGLEDLSIDYDHSFVKVNDHFETSIPNIYAIGDVIGGYQLAHAASNEGIRAIHHIAGDSIVKKAIIPRCVYTFPEIASVGMTELEAKEAGFKVKVKKIDLAGNGKALAANENNGFMKLIAEQKYGEILGVVMVGPHVTEMISQATTFMHLEGTVEEIDTMVFPHPTVSEGLFEAGSAWLGKGIHYS